MSPLVATLIAVAVAATLAAASDTNKIFSPCSDTKVQKSDGFTFGIAFSSRTSFFLDQNITALQLSPCDRRLSSLGGGRLSVFRPKVDEISILTVNTTTDFSPDSNGGYMVAFAGRKYAARSIPAFIANSTYTVTSFTLVLEFQKGRLQNLFWKRDGCARCAGQSNFVCLNKQDCAIRTSSCKRGGGGGDVDCSLGIQLAFSGTDKHYRSLNSWYEVEHLRQYSLYSLYSNLRSSLTDQYNRIFQ